MKPKKKIISHRARLQIFKLAVIIITIILLISPLASSRPKVDMEALVTVIGLDSTDEGVKCTIEIILPKENNGAMGESVVVDGEGKTLSTAFENISISIGRKLEFHHSALIIVGKEKAEKGVLKELEYLLSGGKVSPGIRLMLSGNKDAGEFIQELAKYTKKMDTDNLIKYLAYGAHNYSQELVLFLCETYSESKCSVMPCIEMGEKAENMKAVEGDKAIESSEKEDEKKQKDKSQEDSSGGESGGGGEEGGSGGESGSGGGEEKLTVVKGTEKIGIFNNGKLKTVWEGRVTNGLAWADPETKYGVILLDNFKIKDKTIENLSCLLVKKKVKMKADFYGDTPVLKINVNAQFQLEERSKLYETIGDIEGNISKVIIPAVTEKLQDYISKDILSVLESSKQDGCDGLLMHDKFYRYKNKEYRRFINDGRDLLGECAVEFKYNIKVN